MSAPWFPVLNPVVLLEALNNTTYSNYISSLEKVCALRLNNMCINIYMHWHNTLVKTTQSLGCLSALSVNTIRGAASCTTWRHSIYNNVCMNTSHLYIRTYVTQSDNRYNYPFNYILVYICACINEVSTFRVRFCKR